MAIGGFHTNLNTASASPRADTAARAVIVIGSTRATPHPNARATNPAPSLSGSKRAGAGQFPTVLASPNPYRPDVARNRTRANASGSQILVVSSLALDKPLQQQAHSKGVVLGRALHQARRAIRPFGRFDLTLPARHQVRPGPQKLRVGRHQIEHVSGLRTAPPSLKASSL